MKDTATNGVMHLIEGLDNRVTRLENLNIKVIEQNAMTKAQFDSLGKQITDKMDTVSTHLTEKIEAVDCKVKNLEAGVNRDKSRLVALEDSKKFQEGIWKLVKRYILPVFSAAGSLGIERFFFHRH